MGVIHTYEVIYSSKGKGEIETDSQVSSVGEQEDGGMNRMWGEDKNTGSLRGG